MCGIVGYTGPREAGPILMEGLRRLEYRGYDSAGIALVDEQGELFVEKRAGKLSNLRTAIAERTPHAAVGLAHTRWATHGRPNDVNAHPQVDCTGRITVIHNGIIENFQELRDGLQARGHTLVSETDTEAIAHLIEEAYDGDIADASRAALRRLEGAYALAIMHRDENDRLVGARKDVPLVVGLGEGESFVASDVAAILAHTRQVIFLEEGDVADLRPGGVLVTDVDGRPMERFPETIEWTAEAAEKGGYDTFMLKEIHEQPEALRQSLTGRISRAGRIQAPELEPIADAVREVTRVELVACGTASYAAMVGAGAIQELTDLPARVTVGSEFRYDPPPLDEKTLVIAVTQSGETADTIAAMRLARAQGARTLAITNQLGTQVTREVDSVLYTRAGLEIGVAATKTFTAQVALLSLIALKLAQIRKTLPADEIEFILEELYDLPDKMEHFLDGDHPIEEIAERHHNKPFFLYLGRHIGLPVALEGALKLKEISYIPTEAYSAGEMKHGPIALLDSETPVVCVATDQKVVYEKVVSNIQEVRARGAQVIAIATDGNEDVQHHADDVIYIPRTPAFLQAVLAVLPLQLLAYRIARLRGLNVDQPRNLAKTVTVE
jgi:glucosamine--fructose-6-phosphate aminotransferase (isomerizing)